MAEHQTRIAVEDANRLHANPIVACTPVTPNISMLVGFPGRQPTRVLPFCCGTRKRRSINSHTWIQRIAQSIADEVGGQDSYRDRCARWNPEPGHALQNGQRLR